jgi:hypothetical protein
MNNEQLTQLIQQVTKKVDGELLAKIIRDAVVMTSEQLKKEGK